MLPADFAALGLVLAIQKSGVTERGDLKELLNQKNKRLFPHKIIVNRNHVETITSAHVECIERVYCHPFVSLISCLSLFCNICHMFVTLQNHSLIEVPYIVNCQANTVP